MSVAKLGKVLVCVMLVVAVEGRYAGRRHHHNKQNQADLVTLPLFRSMEDSSESIPMLQKLVLVKPRASDVDTGRTLKHFLLYKGLMDQDKNKYDGGYGGGHGSGYGGGHGGGYGGGYGSGYGGGHGGGYMLPYIIINNPTNLTNINNNTIANEQAGTTTTGTNDDGNGLRYSYYNNGQGLPLPIQPPTPVYQQRQDNPTIPFGLALPTSMMLTNGGLLPLPIPNNKKSPNRRRGQRRPVPAHNSNGNNPFKAFANNLKRFQFFQI